MDDNKNRTYTYRRSKKKAQQRAMLILFCGFAFLLFLSILFGALFGNRSAVLQSQKERESISANQSTTVPSTEIPQETSLYSAGNYIVDTDGGASLNLRKNYSLNSEILTEIQNKTPISILEIYHDKNASVGKGEIEYWGKCTYNNYTGWVAMKHLKKDSASTASDPSATNNTDPSGTADSTSDSSAPYTPGSYSVQTDGYGLSLRESPSRDADVYDVLSDDDVVTVLEIVKSSETEEEYRYWGKVEYDGETLYLPMGYLVKEAE